jgi:hypothetical protein
MTDAQQEISAYGIFMEGSGLLLLKKSEWGEEGEYGETKETEKDLAPKSFLHT